MPRKNRIGRNTHRLADIGLPELPPPKRCGRCAYCKGLEQCSEIPGFGKTKELAAIFTLKKEISPMQFRRLSEFSDAACVDLGGLLGVFFPVWVNEGMIPAILDDVKKIIGVDTFTIINGCG